MPLRKLRDGRGAGEPRRKEKTSSRHVPSSCHVERSASISIGSIRISGAESKHREDVSGIHAASGNSLDGVSRTHHGENSLTLHLLSKHSRDVSTPRPSAIRCIFLRGAPL